MQSERLIFKKVKKYQWRKRLRVERKREVLYHKGVTYIFGSQSKTNGLRLCD
jgi:hypothetical protein